MTSIESSLDDFADAECSLFCILLLGKTRLADTCRLFIGASAYVDMSMYDRIVDYSKPNRWAKLKTLFSHVFLVSSYIFRIDYLCVSDGNSSHCILSFLGSPQCRSLCASTSCCSDSWLALSSANLRTDLGNSLLQTFEEWCKTGAKWGRHDRERKNPAPNWELNCCFFQLWSGMRTQQSDEQLSHGLLKWMLFCELSPRSLCAKILQYWSISKWQSNRAND